MALQHLLGDVADAQEVVLEEVEEVDDQVAEEVLFSGLLSRDVVQNLRYEIYLGNIIIIELFNIAISKNIQISVVLHRKLVQKFLVFLPQNGAQQLRGLDVENVGDGLLREGVVAVGHALGRFGLLHGDLVLVDEIGRVLVVFVFVFTFIVGIFGIAFGVPLVELFVRREHRLFPVVR